MIRYCFLICSCIYSNVSYHYNTLKTIEMTEQAAFFFLDTSMAINSYMFWSVIQRLGLREWQKPKRNRIYTSFVLYTSIYWLYNKLVPSYFFTVSVDAYCALEPGFGY